MTTLYEPFLKEAIAQLQSHLSSDIAGRSPDCPRHAALVSG